MPRPFRSTWSWPLFIGALEHFAFGWNQTRHCERSEAIQRTSGPYVPLDCFVADAPRNDDSKPEQLSLAYLTRNPQNVARRGASLLLERPVEEVADQRNHFIRLVFEHEVAGVDEVKFDVGQVALVGVSSIGRENFVVFAPDDQSRGLILTEIGLDRRIERDIGR